MAAGQRKFEIREVRFKKEGADISADVEYRWGVEEANGFVLWRGNTTSFSKAEILALTSVEQRTAIADIFQAMRAATKLKASELANAVD